MTNKRTFHKALILLIAAVWLINGLFCKLLNMAPRHQQIVARILGDENAGFLTTVIGVAEVLMALWILSGIKARLNAVTQITVVAAMNMLEFIQAPDLLLWGRGNMFFAVFFILVIYYNEFGFNKKLAEQA